MLVSLATIWLSGCGQKVSSPELEIYCPAPAPYSDQFNNKLADEIEALPATSSAITQAIGDYARLRDKLRRCDEIRRDI